MKYDAYEAYKARHEVAITRLNALNEIENLTSFALTHEFMAKEILRITADCKERCSAIMDEYNSKAL